MSKDEYYTQKRIADCKDTMDIKNLSGHALLVTIQRKDGVPIEYGDICVEMKGGDWYLNLDGSPGWIDAMRKEDS